jgi:large-conductance mechanosensitive channel
MSNFPDYLRDTKILSLSTFIAAFTYGYISKISTIFLDPLFDFLFPATKLNDIEIKLSNTKTLEIGTFILETVRWLLYMIIFYIVYKDVFKQ